MDDAQWDSPKRSKLFLAAALAVAVTGTMVSARFGVGDIPNWETAGSEAKLKIDPSQPLPLSSPSPSKSFMEAGGAAAPDSAKKPADTEDPFSADGSLRDALASPSAQAAPSQAASAAFAGPAGRLPGAFAPASAPSAQAAARRRLSGFAGAAPAGASRLRAGGAQGRTFSSESVGASASRSPSAADASRRASRLDARTPAERFFSGANLSGAGSPLHAGFARPSSEDDEPASEAARRSRRGAHKLHPALLSKLLGKHALKSPQGVAVPSFKPWSLPIPAAGPGGEEISPRPLGLAAAEGVAPPSACERGGSHWHDDPSGARWLHEGKIWGRASEAGWAWAQRDGGRLWLYPETSGAPLLRWEEHWWLRSRGLWFLMHDGAPWGARFLEEWGSEGFVHPSGARMIYSADGSRVGLIEPDAGAILYDAQDGTELGRWTPQQLPKPRPAKVPSRLPPLR